MFSTSHVAIKRLDAPVVEDTKPQRTNRIAIFDRSGSMGWALDKVVDDLFNWVSRVPKGDTISIGWFSGPGQYRFALKGARVDTPEDLSMIRKVLDANRNPIGTTCFSEILGDLAEVVQDLSPITDRFSLVFFTDGCPVVPDVRAEVAAIEKNLTAVKPRISTALYVGYGDYYNRSLMSNMACWSNGALVHADNINQFAVEIGNFTQADKGLPVVEMKVNADALVFTIQDGKPVVHTNANGTTRVPAGHCLYTIEFGAFEPDAKEAILEQSLQGLYAACIVLSRMNKADYALDILGAIGEANLASKLSNAYTVSEIGNAETFLSSAITNPAERFVGGKKVGCVPDRNAFCVLDALRLLAEDDDAVFFPSHETFSYKRIGVRTFIAEGYSKFEANKALGCPLNTLVYHETRMNVSIGTKISGTIELTDECANYGLGKKFPTYQHRNYTIVKDGALNVDVLPASMSEATFKVLLEQGAVTGTWVKDQVFPISLCKLPVINRGMADGHRSATDLCGTLANMYSLEGKLKAFRYYMKQCDPDGHAGRPESILTPEAISYLDGLGVGKNGYSPKKVSEIPTDTYFAREFVVAAKGMSSLPKIEDVIKRRADGKDQTKSGKVVLAGIEEFETMAAESAKRHHHLTDDKQLIKALQAQIVKDTTELRKLRYKVQRAKFAILLGNQWFDEFDTRENCKLTVGDYEFSFQVKESVQDC